MDLALVVPAYFIFAGILLFAAVVAVALGLYRGGGTLYYTFAAACLASSLVAVATASYYISEAVPGAIIAQRWLATGTLLVAGTLIAFVAVYTGLQGQGRWLLGLGSAIVVLIVANHMLPVGVRWSSIESMRWLHLPWGESLFFLEGESGAWAIAYRGITVIAGTWALWRLATLMRTGRRRAAIFLAACMAVAMLASVQAALIDAGVLHTFHVSGFAMVFLAMLAAAGLVVRLHEHNVELEATARQLRAENDLRREAEAQIRERAYCDVLTALPNRAYVQDHLGTFLGSPDATAYGAAMLLDLDHFKVVNDGLSHEVGDELLRVLAARLSGAVPSDALVARVGGDEFLVVLAERSDDEDGVRAAIDVLASAVSRLALQPVSIGERSLHLSASIGVAVFDLPDTSPAEVLRRVGMALDRAKRRGRNNVQRYVPELQAGASERFRVVEGLKRALDANELALRYQPVVSSQGALLGAEALMRWRPPEGEVSPAVFIPIAEETGLIHPLGEWSLREGCRVLASWSGEAGGFQGTLAVNVSPWQLARPDFVARTRAIVEASRIDPARLCLEITESAVLFDVEETIAKLRELRPLGVRIALDDFGTGYSSLALLKDLPIDVIKIDRSFVRGIGEAANQHLVRVVVAIGDELGLDVVAEGIETEAERDQLATLGITRMQGYFFARPMASDEFLRWLAARTKGARVTV